MKRALLILIIGIIACEEVVVVDLPAPQNLVVVQAWLTDSTSFQSVNITRSNGFSDNDQVQPIEDAEVIVQSRIGDVFTYTYNPSSLRYESDIEYAGAVGIEYRLRIVIDTFEIRSEWDRMSEPVPISSLQVDSFVDNDPDNPDRQLTIFYPKVTTTDPGDIRNYYRWIFYKNGVAYTEPDPITIQNDRLFDGNLIPNNFQSFGYDSGEEITVQLQSISANTHDYLSILKSQITTLGTSSGTTPAIVNGNLINLNDPSNQVLGYFGVVSGSVESVVVP